MRGVHQRTAALGEIYARIFVRRAANVRFPASARRHEQTFDGHRKLDIHVHGSRRRDKAYARVASWWPQAL